MTTMKTRLASLILLSTLAPAADAAKSIEPGLVVQQACFTQDVSYQSDADGNVQLTVTVIPSCSLSGKVDLRIDGAFAAMAPLAGQAVTLRATLAAAGQSLHSACSTFEGMKLSSDRRGRIVEVPYIG